MKKKKAGFLKLPAKYGRISKILILYVVNGQQKKRERYVKAFSNDAAIFGD
jgi:hypothetical protein